MERRRVTAFYQLVGRAVYTEGLEYISDEYALQRALKEQFPDHTEYHPTESDYQEMRGTFLQSLRSATTPAAMARIAIISPYSFAISEIELDGKGVQMALSGDELTISHAISAAISNADPLRDEETEKAGEIARRFGHFDIIMTGVDREIAKLQAAFERERPRPGQVAASHPELSDDDVKNLREGLDKLTRPAAIAFAACVRRSVIKRTYQSWGHRHLLRLAANWGINGNEVQGVDIEDQRQALWSRLRVTFDDDWQEMSKALGAMKEGESPAADGLFEADKILIRRIEQPNPKIPAIRHLADEFRRARTHKNRDWDLQTASFPFPSPQRKYLDVLWFFRNIARAEWVGKIREAVERSYGRSVTGLHREAYQNLLIDMPRLRLPAGAHIESGELRGPEGKAISYPHAVPADMLSILSEFVSISERKVFEYIVNTVRYRWANQHFLPRGEVFFEWTVDGGYAEIARIAKVGTNSAARKDVENAFLRLSQKWNGKYSEGAAPVAHSVVKAAPGRKARITIVVTEILRPDWVKKLPAAAQRDGRLCDIIPFVGIPDSFAAGPRTHMAEVLLRDRAMLHLRDHADQIVSHGGVFIPWPQWRVFAEECGRFPKDPRKRKKLLRAIIEKMVSKDRLLSREGDRYSVCTDGPYAPYAAMLHEGGDKMLTGRANQKKGDERKKRKYSK